MTYPPPPGQPPYPPQQFPPKKKGIAWWVIPAVIAAVCGIGLVGVAIDDDKDKGAAATTTRAPAPAAPAFSAPAAPTVPTSTTPPVTNVAIPDVVGKNGAVATDALKRAGFTNVTHGSATPGVDMVLMLSNWTVTAVEPGEGSVVPTDSAVVLTMTKNNR